MRKLSPSQSQKVSAILARLLGRAARYTPRLFCICKANAILHALLRELLDLMRERAADLLDKAWGLEPNSRLSCQTMVNETPLVIEIPRYSINMAKEGKRYTNQEGKQFLHEVAERHYYHLLNASLKLGKELGKGVYNRLTGAEEASAEDASTQGLINYFRGRHRG